MLKIKTRKPSLWLAVLAVVFAVTWAVWSFVLVPGSPVPSRPVPVAPAAR